VVGSRWADKKTPPIYGTRLAKSSRSANGSALSHLRVPRR
jgi:hypothetical protein